MKIFIFVIHVQAATIAKELLNAGTSPTADAIAKKSVSNSSPSLPPHLPQLPTSGKKWDDNSHYIRMSAGQGVSPKEQLAYLSQVLGFTVTYTDFPKKGEYLSLVSLSTTPPQVRPDTLPTGEIVKCYTDHFLLPQERKAVEIANNKYWQKTIIGKHLDLFL